MTTVFVYGSLRKGLSNHHLLDKAKYLGTYRADIGMDMVDLGSFPGLVPYTGEFPYQITLEAYEVDDKTFQDLDRLEGYPSFYNRKIVRVGEREGYVYYLNSNNYPSSVVKDGDWLEYYIK